MATLVFRGLVLNPFKILFAVDRFLYKIELFFMTLCLMVLLFFAFLQVILRNFFDTAIHWGDIFNRLMVLWIGMFAATTAAKMNRHLSLEVLTKFLPEKAKPISDLFVNLFVVFVAAMLTVSSYNFFQDQLMYESSDVLFEGFPIAYFSIIFPIGFGLITFRYFVKIFEVFYRFAGGDVAYADSCDGSNDDSDLEISVKIKL
jgi:TRAP-type C4-dicarboxylate transport system permease small subunit